MKSNTNTGSQRNSRYIFLWAFFTNMKNPSDECVPRKLFLFDCCKWSVSHGHNMPRTISTTQCWESRERKKREQPHERKENMVTEYSDSAAETCEAAFRKRNLKIPAFLPDVYTLCVRVYGSRATHKRHSDFGGSRFVDRRRIGQQNTLHFRLDVRWNPLRSNSPDAFIELVEKQQRATGKKRQRNTMNGENVVVFTWSWSPGPHTAHTHAQKEKKNTEKMDFSIFKITFLFSARFRCLCDCRAHCPSDQRERCETRITETKTISYGHENDNKRNGRDSLATASQPKINTKRMLLNAVR